MREGGVFLVIFLVEGEFADLGVEARDVASPRVSVPKDVAVEVEVAQEDRRGAIGGVEDLHGEKLA